jgi:uncharacterized membrane protein
MKYIGLVCSLVLFLSCLNDKNTPLANLPITVDSTTVIIPSVPAVNCSPDTVYFQQSVLPLITSNCSMSGCHDAISHKEGVNLTDYTNIRKEVSAFNPTSSELYKCLNETGDKRMPPAPSAEFSLTQKSLLLKWIQQGAKNNTCSNTATCDTVNVTFSASVLPVLKTYCVGCHSAASPSAGIDLSTYAAVKVYAANGRLMGSITHAIGYKPMPSSTSKLGACEINQIKAWVTKGTLNN